MGQPLCEDDEEGVENQLEGYQDDVRSTPPSRVEDSDNDESVVETTRSV